MSISSFAIDFKTNLKKLLPHCRYYFTIAWLPVTLVIIFVLQNHLFNIWLNISPTHYIIRRTFVTAAFGVLLFGPGILFSKLIKYLYLSFTSLLMATFFIIQFLYYSYSGGFLQSSAFFYVGEGLSVIETAKTLLTYHLLFFTIGPLLVVGTFIWIIKNKIIEKILSKKEKLWAGAILAIMVTFGYGYLFTREYMEAGNTVHIYQFNHLYDVNALVSKAGIINFSLGDVASLIFSSSAASADEINFVKSWKERQPKLTSTSKNFGLAKGKNLIFIQVESLEHSVIGEKINNQEITPNLNKLAKEGMYFSNYYTQIGPGTTADAEFSILNSLYPLPDTVAFIEYAYNKYTALPALLKSNGYHTYSMHGDVSSFWNRANIYPSLGYEKWFSKPDYTISRNIGPYNLGDEEFFTQSLPKLKSLPRPFMATLITLSSHSPFKLPDDLNTLSIPPTTTLNTIQQNYVQSVHYTDQTIGKFIEELKQNDLYDNSLIVILGDHGGFTNVGAALKSTTEKTIFADLQNSQVPLIILAPKTKLQGTNPAPSSHIDLYPTLTNLLGIKTPTSTIMVGQDILNSQSPVVTQRNLISGTVKAIITNKIAFHAGAEGLFDNGICVELPSKKRLPIENCRALYNKESETLLASDLMIKNNLITADTEIK